ncbi:MAG: replication-relaxation family protein [Armatimonadetes bacterium]|nr:replication-relaxation family protein [Armatimonadota bacterium]
MRLTTRDRNLLTEIALHQVVNRNQLIALGFFSSTQRANARLLSLRKAGLIRRLGQEHLSESALFLYAVKRKAASLLEPRVAALVSGRTGSPRFIAHSIAVVDARIALAGGSTWLHEQQVRHRFSIPHGVRSALVDVRPDGAILKPTAAVFVEVDLGHASASKLKAKLESYDAYIKFGVFKATYPNRSLTLLFATTGKRRCRLIRALASQFPSLEVRVTTLPTIAAIEASTEVSS